MRISHLVRATGLAAILALSACGITYVSPVISEADGDLTVRVVTLAPDTVALANQTPYTPRSLPAAFRQSTGTGQIRGMGVLPDAPVFPQTDPQRPEARYPPDGQPAPYRLGIGDVIRLATRTTDGAPAGFVIDSLGRTQREDYTLRDDGAISVPGVGAVMIEGLTIEEAETRLFQRFIEAGLDPNFSLEVQGFNSRRISVGGDVGAVTLVPVGLSLPTLDEALTAAGGVRVTEADYAVIQVYRDGALYQIPVQDYESRAELRRLRLLPGDSLFVSTTYDLDRALDYYAQQIELAGLRRADRSAALTELQAEIALRRSALDEQRALFTARTDLGAEPRDHVYLTGEVTRQSRVPLPYDQTATLADMLFGAGGFPTMTGNPGQIYVLRASSDPRDPGAVTAWQLDAANAANLILATRFEMRPDDIIFVGEQPITRWNRALQQAFPVLLNSAARAAE